MISRLLVAAGATAAVAPTAANVEQLGDDNRRAQPLFPALRLGPTAVPRAFREKQIPSSNYLITLPFRATRGLVRRRSSCSR